MAINEVKLIRSQARSVLEAVTILFLPVGYRREESTEECDGVNKMFPQYS